jgi:hypothetical protein
MKTMRKVGYDSVQTMHVTNWDPVAEDYFNEYHPGTPPGDNTDILAKPVWIAESDGIPLTEYVIEEGTGQRLVLEYTSCTDTWDVTDLWTESVYNDGMPVTVYDGRYGL